MEDRSLWGYRGEATRGHLRRQLNAAGANEDVVCAVDAKQQLGVAEGAGRLDVESALGEDGSGEGAEIGGGVEDEQARAGSASDFCAGERSRKARMASSSLSKFGMIADILVRSSRSVTKGGEPAR